MPKRKFTAAKLPEAEFQNMVLAYARKWGWHYYHTHDSRGSQRGFPDLVFCKAYPEAPDMFYAELKSEKGRVRKEQKFWMKMLAYNGNEVHLWRPADWDAITERLSR